MSDLVLKRGDDETVQLLLTDPEGVGADPDDPSTWPPIDLAGATLWWYVKASTTDSDAEAIIAKTTGTGIAVIGPTADGRADVTIVPADTETLPNWQLDTELDWEVQLKDAANKIRTVGEGTVTIESDIVLTPNPLDPTPATSWTYDPTTSAGQVRLLAQDFDVEEPIFSDAEIAAFLSLNSDDVRYAAAQALEVIAANEVYVQKRIKILDLWTDGPREAEQLMKLAAQYREQANANATVDEMFDWAELVYNEFTWVERVNNEFQREFA